MVIASSHHLLMGISPIHQGAQPASASICTTKLIIQTDLLLRFYRRNYAEFSIPGRSNHGLGRNKDGQQGDWQRRSSSPVTPSGFFKSQNPETKETGQVPFGLSSVNIYLLGWRLILVQLAPLELMLPSSE
jgi:hypothetical protein